jgi:hypothetical protein
MGESPLELRNLRTAQLGRRVPHSFAFCADEWEYIIVGVFNSSSWF